MATKTTDATTTGRLRRCIGSDPLRHRGPRGAGDDFPVQPSQKDGLGRMCRPHWREYTNALRKAAVARKAEAAEARPGARAQVAEPRARHPSRRRRHRARPAAPRPSPRRRPTPGSSPVRHTTGPGRESGAFVRPVASVACGGRATYSGSRIVPTARYRGAHARAGTAPRSHDGETLRSQLPAACHTLTQTCGLCPSWGLYEKVERSLGPAAVHPAVTGRSPPRKSPFIWWMLSQLGKVRDGFDVVRNRPTCRRLGHLCAGSSPSVAESR